VIATSSGLHVDLHEGRGPPILMVHGILAGRALWGANLAALQAVARPVVLELFGHGRSTSPSDPAAYHPDAYVAAFEEIRCALGVDRWFVLGHSLGAALTLRYAIDHADRVVAHVLTNSLSALADSALQERIRANADAAADRVVKHGLAHITQSKTNPARSHRVVPTVREALTSDEPLLQPAGVAGTIRYTGPASAMRDRVGSNIRPSLLIAGAKEHAFVEPCRYAQAAMPELTVARINAGHSPNAEAPNAFNEVVTRFLNDARG
jgi:2-succinyl-6-hydroxy-2,4-cyclohexadiene-1-carboxylate synthase